VRLLSLGHCLVLGLEVGLGLWLGLMSVLVCGIGLGIW
jgi:hypothetical protein